MNCPHGLHFLHWIIDIIWIIPLISTKYLYYYTKNLWSKRNENEQTIRNRNKNNSFISK